MSWLSYSKITRLQFVGDKMIEYLKDYQVFAKESVSSTERKGKKGMLQGLSLNTCTSTHDHLNAHAGRVEIMRR